MTHKIIIIDPGTWCPGLKTLFKDDSIYYAHEPDNFFDYTSVTKHLNNNNFEKKYGFRYNSLHNLLNGTIELSDEIFFIVFPLLDGIENHHFTKQNAVNMLHKIYDFLKNKKSKKILFDIYDYDYDPSTIYIRPANALHSEYTKSTQPIDIFFKRNYSQKKIYNNNVYPFPFCMFIQPCLLNTICLQSERNSNGICSNNSDVDFTTKINGIFWSGGIYIHEDKIFNVYRDRKTLFEKIKNYLDVFDRLDQHVFLEKIKSYKLCLDLNGVGDPNFRTFEILLNGSLLFQTKNDLKWPFEEEFPPRELIFDNEEDFLNKKSKLLKDESFYQEILSKQKYIVNKYFNKDWIKEYIVQKIKCFKEYC